MRPTTAITVRFVRLDVAMHQLGSRAPQEFLAELRTLSDQERRDVADLVKQEG